MARVEDSPWAIPVAQIASRAGQSKPIDADFPAPSGIGDSIVGIKEGEPVHVSGQFDSIVDGLIFTGGIGENSPLIRSKTVEHLKLFNLTLDAQANARCIRGVAGAIGAEGHPRVLVVPTNEERQIALDTLALLTA